MIDKIKEMLHSEYMKGFTLVELMIVISVIAILSTISLFGLTAAQKSARDTQRMQMASSVRTALEKYNGDKAGYPVLATFSDMFTALSSAGYMTTAVDPSCGSGNITLALAAAQFSAGNWYPCNPATNKVPEYSYNGVATGYTVTVFKEGGGSSNFKGVQ